MPRIPKSSGRICRKVKCPRISRPCSDQLLCNTRYEQAALFYCFALKSDGCPKNEEPLRSLFTWSNLTGIQKAWLCALFGILRIAKFDKGELQLSEEQQKFANGALLQGFVSEFNHLLLSGTLEAYITFKRVDPSESLTEKEFKETFYEEFFHLLGISEKPSFAELAGE